MLISYIISVLIAVSIERFVYFKYKKNNKIQRRIAKIFFHYRPVRTVAEYIVTNMLFTPIGIFSNISELRSFASLNDETERVMMDVVAMDLTLRLFPNAENEVK